MDENSTPSPRSHLDNTSAEFTLFAVIVSLQLQANYLSQVGHLKSDNAYESIYKL